MRLLFGATSIVVAILFAFNLFTITFWLVQQLLWHISNTLSIANYFIVATLFPRQTFPARQLEIKNRTAKSTEWWASIVCWRFTTS